MDWSKQAQDMMKTWTDTQQKIMDSMVKTMKEMNTGPTASTWETTIENWEKSVRNFLQTQADWANMWPRGLNSMPNVPGQNMDWQQQIQQMVRLMTEYQEQFWTGWFTVLKRLDPAKTSESFNSDMQKMVESWIENAQRMLAMQAEWLRNVVPAADKKE